MYNDIITSFEELLVKDKTFTIDHQNIQSLVIEMYKAVNNLPGGNYYPLPTALSYLHKRKNDSSEQNQKY